MDLIPIDALLGALPQAGAGGVFLFILFLMVRRESTAQERFTLEYDRINAAHDSELSELREQIVALRAQIDDLQNKLDTEREERRRAEDEAAEARRSTSI